MAGVVKGPQQAVSNGIPPTDPDPVCVPETNSLDTLFDAFNDLKDANADAQLHDPDKNSLQDMIESELAFRMSACVAEEEGDGDAEEDADEDADADADADVLSSPSDHEPVLNGVHDFLERERSHCSESASLSVSASCSEEQAAPLCSGDDFDDVLGASEPADSDFSPNIPHELEQDADEGTIAEGVSEALDDPERKSLLDLDPLDADPRLQLDGSSEAEPLAAAEEHAAGAAVEVEVELEEAEVVEEEGGERAAVRHGLADAEDSASQREAERGDVNGDVDDNHIDAPGRVNGFAAVETNSDARVLVPNSMDVDSLPQPQPQPQPQCVAILPEGQDGALDSWSTVGDALGSVHDRHQDSASDTETLSESDTKNIVKKKKSSAEGGDATVIKKKSKKNKKSDSEKENISVALNGHIQNGHDHVDDSSMNHGGFESLIKDDLSNVNVRELKTAFCNTKQTGKTKESHKAIDHDIIYCGPIQSLKQTYCSEVTKLTNGTDNSDRKQKIATGISIRDLRRSFGDLRNLEDDGSSVENLQVEGDINAESKARSLGDLRRLSRDSTRMPESDTRSASPCRKPIHTGVSVKALKSSFSKFDQLSKKTVLHVRSVDASKVQKQFNDCATASPESQSTCKSCGKQVFVMEQIKAERAVWHKNCFRCKECCKQLTVDTYSSNEGELYCKPHFRELFKPKAVIEQETEPVRRRRPEMIIRENQPVELPPDVVRASDKPDLGLEELSSLNVKSRFQVFEKTDANENDLEKSPSTVNVKRSPSILSKLAKFQAKGMDIGVTDDSLNGIHYEESSTSSEEEEDETDDGDVVKASRNNRERPMSFSKMEDIKCRWESGATQKEERREERKQEIQNIRSRLFMGKQVKMKEMYEQAVKESEQPGQRKGAEVRSEKAKSIKEKFEKGEPLVSADDEDDEKERKNKEEEERSVFEAGISKKSRSMFMELDATAAKSQPITPTKSASRDEARKTREVLVNRQPSAEVVKSSDALEDVRVETADVSSKFKFFETYKEPEKQRKEFRITPPREGQVKTESPDREVYRDPEVVRAEDHIKDGLVNSHTASKMLSIFRQMEEKANKDDVPDGPKPLKCFTPPPDYTRDSGSSEEESSEEDEEDEEEEEAENGHSGVIRASDKVEDEFLKAAKEAARAKTLRAKFEHWEEQENNVNTGGGNLNSPLLDSEQDSIESTKSLRARFESLKSETEQPKEKARPKVNRFVEIQTNCAEFCAACEKKVYPLEKIETGGRLFHKQCFRCLQCCTVLRMETYTLNNGKLYCIPHFKQLFISKGNYDEGFGLDQHKMKWKRENGTNGDIVLSGIETNGTTQ